MIGFRKSAVLSVAAAGAAIVFIVAADRLPAKSTAEGTAVSRLAHAVPEASAPAAPGQDQFSRANLWAATGPALDDVRQSEVGDCYFDAAMAAVAHTQPSRVVNAISYDPRTGDFIVHLYNYAEGRDYIPGTHGDGKPWPADVAVVPMSIAVTQQDLRDDIAFGGASSLDDGAPGYIWPAVMEAAYAKMLFASYPGHPEVQADEGPVVSGLRIAEATNPVNPLWSGADVDQGMATITGRTGAYTPAELSSYEALAAAIADRRPVTMGTSPSTRHFQDQLVFNHQYTVVGIAKSAGGAIQLTVRNPWGSNDGVPDVQDPAASTVVVDLRQALADHVIGSFDIGPEPGA